MRSLKLALLATVAVVGITSAASAADLIIGSEPGPVYDDYASVDWSGPYAGLWVSGQTGSIFGLGANLGVNVLIDKNLLAGAEGSVAWLSDDSWQGKVHGKFGFADGTFAIYGLAGIGVNSITDAYAPVGVGAEVMLADNLSLKAEYQYQWDLDTSADDAHVAKFGFNWHF